ncbi:type II secretion system protein [Paenibacillus sp. FSL W7-1287]|uniref:type II secretion system protein n=1 Tax=Paenibacillus sp. FSL W7-1287 TaxID=2954538 RepID=UPI0030FC30C6
MGNKKIFKPSEFETDEFLGKTKIVIREVLKYFQKSKDYDESIKAKLERLSDMEITKLYDCKIAAELIFSVGMEYKNKKRKGKGIWSDPMFLGSFTLIELLIGMVLTGIVVTIIYLF